METTVVSGTGGNGTPPPRSVGAAGAFISDARLALMVINQGRYYALRRMFGVSREEANLLTFVIALTVGDAAFAGARRVVHAPLTVSAGDVGLAGATLRETALSIAGPEAREVPLVGTLVTAAVLGGIALPGLRRGVRGIRAAEHRMRLRRIAIYNAARSAVKAPQAPVGEPQATA